MIYENSAENGAESGCIRLLDRSRKRAFALVDEML